MDAVIKTKGRIDWIDFIKGIAILWLIVYHFYVFPWLSSPVPIFFFLSGIFFSDKKAFLSFCGHKGKALLIPFVFFYMIGLLVSLLSHVVQGTMWNGGDLHLFLTLIPADSAVRNPLGVGAIWFLPCLFELYVIYYAVRRITKNKILLLLFAVGCMSVASVLLKFYAMGSFFYIFNTLQFIIYFIIGHIFRDLWLNVKTSVALIISCLLMFLVLTFVYYQSCHFILVDCLDKIKMLFFIILVISLVKLKGEGKCMQLINIYGRNSLTVLGIHMIGIGVCRVVLDKIALTKFSYYGLMFIGTVTITLICIFIFNKLCPVLVNAKR